MAKVILDPSSMKKSILILKKICRSPWSLTLGKIFSKTLIGPWSFRNIIYIIFFCPRKKYFQKSCIICSFFLRKYSFPFKMFLQKIIKFCSLILIDVGSQGISYSYFIAAACCSTDFPVHSDLCFYTNILCTVNMISLQFLWQNFQWKRKHFPCRREEREVKDFVTKKYKYVVERVGVGG